MTFDYWFEIVTAVFAGNMLFLVYGYFLWYIAKQDQKKLGITFDDLPIWVLLIGAVPLGLVGWTIAQLP